MIRLQNNFYVTSNQYTEVDLAGFPSMSPCDAYMRHWTGSALVQIMACRMFGAQPLPEPILIYILDPYGQTSVIN